MFSFRRRFSLARLLRSRAPQTPQESDRQFQIRLLVAFGSILFAFSILFARFVWLQVFQFDHFSTLAQQNRISFVPIVPNRGLIVDRNGVVLVQNYSAYTLELTPSKIPDLPLLAAALLARLPAEARVSDLRLTRLWWQRQPLALRAALLLVPAALALGLLWA